MTRSIASHCYLFLLVCFLLLFVTWYKDDRRFEDSYDVSTDPSPIEQIPISSPNPIDRPTTRSPCLHIDKLKRILKKKTKPRFHAVPPLDLFIYSAYLDLRQNNGHIVLIGTASNFSESYDTVRTSTGSLVCLLVDGRRMVRIRGSIEVETGYVGIKPRSSAILIRCPVNKIPSVTAKVGLAFNYCDSAPFYLPITHIPRSPKRQEGTEVCVSPLPEYFNNWTQIMEFVEHHRLLGTNHFTFYLNHLGKETKATLWSYEKEGIVSLVPWRDYPFYDEHDLKFSSTKVSSSNSVAMQDCLYRRMNLRYPYLLFLNVDNAIFPNSKLGNYSLNSLIREHIFSHLRRTCLRIRHYQASKKYVNIHQVKSQWLIRADAILSMKSHWIGNFLRGSGFDVPSSTAMIRPLSDCRRHDINEVRYQILKDRVTRALSNVFL